jgi:hypothetical protein
MFLKIPNNSTYGGETYITVPIWMSDYDVQYREELAEFLMDIGYGVYRMNATAWVSNTFSSGVWCLQRGSANLMHNTRTNPQEGHYNGFLVIPGCFKFLSVKESL